MKTLDLRVDAGRASRPASLLAVPLDLADLDRIAGVQIQRQGQDRPSEYEFQRDLGQGQVLFLADAMQPGEEAVYQLTLVDTGDRPAPPAADRIILTAEEGARVRVEVDGELFTTYHHGDQLARPCFHPVNAAGGRAVTRAYPMQQALPGEHTDHPHHRGLWVAHGEVNGHDNWSEETNHGRTRHTGFENMRNGPILGHLEALLEWQTAGGDHLLTERRLARFHVLPGSIRVIDLEVALQSGVEPVTFGDTKEGGICSIRVAGSMEGDRGGRIEDADGRVGEKQAWGKRSRWCDYSGQVQDQVVGVAILDHPDNFRHPTYWHVRDYGLMTANPFGVSVFTGDAEQNGAHILAAGESMVFRYRVLIHPGAASDADVAGHYAAWVDPPAVTLAG